MIAMKERQVDKGKGSVTEIINYDIWKKNEQHMQSC